MGSRGQSKAHAEGNLRRSVTPAQGVALYVGAVVGTGVLVLPGTAASLAGPASVLAWAFVSVLGVPLALTFAALAGRYPDAGGVATFTGRAFGPAWGAAVGWFYFFASTTAMSIGPLIGAYYAAGPLGLGRGGTFLLGAAMLAFAVASNADGLRVSGRVQLALSGCVALLLLVASAPSVPRMSVDNGAPFAPEGWAAAGHVAVCSSSPCSAGRPSPSSRRSSRTPGATCRAARSLASASSPSSTWAWPQRLWAPPPTATRPWTGWRWQGCSGTRRG